MVVENVKIEVFIKTIIRDNHSGRSECVSSKAALNWFDVLMFHFAFNLIDMIIRSEMEKYNFSLKCL